MVRKALKSEKGRPNDELRSLPPAPNQHRLPLDTLHDVDFEQILADIAEKEPGIVRVEMKRISGVAQYGVDVEGFSAEQKPTLIISCKRYRRIQPANLTTWSNEFLDHVDGHWKDRGVERFVLAVSVELNDDGLNERIALESARFKAVGIGYEIWGLKKLTEKLRPLPHAIAKFFSPGWLESIGAATALAATTTLPNSSTSTSNSTATSAVAQSLSGVSEAVRQRFGDSVATQLENTLQQLREGVEGPLRSCVENLKADRLAWDMLSAEVKAKFLRAEGSLAIRNQDLASAKECYIEADVYAPAPDRTPSALLERLEAGAAFALRLVENPMTSSEAGIRAGLLLELGRSAEALAVLDAWPNTSPTDDVYEPARLRAIAELWHDRPAALATISAIEDQAPRQFAVQWAAAVVRFNFALSEKFDPTLSTFPNPIPLGIVRDTEDARTALEEAERIFDILCRAVDSTELAADLQVWRLACLILNPARFTDSAKFATTLLNGDSPHPGAVVWATSAGLSFDHDEVVRALNAQLKTGKADASHAVAVAYLTFTRGTKGRAISGLRRHRKLFHDEADLSLIDYWTGLLTGEGGDSQTQKLNGAIGKLRSQGSASDLLSLLDSGVLPADMQLAAFETLALHGKWVEVNDRRNSILAFGTSRASALVIRAAFNLNLHQDVVALASEQASTFFSSQLPTDLVVLVARSRLSLGDASLALRALEALRADDNSDALAFELAIMRLQIGDLTGAASTIRGRQAPPDSPEAVLKIAAELRSEDPELARRLLEGFSFDELNHHSLPNALALVNELGIQTAAEVIMPRLLGPDAEQSDMVVIDSVEEVLEFVRENANRRQEADAELTEKWLRCELPLHLVFNGRVGELAWFFYKPFRARPQLQDDGKLPGKPFLLHCGGRRVDHEASSDVLVLDATALLLGHELGLLEQLELGWKRILLPNETVELLRTMEAELEYQFGPVADEVRDVRQRIEAGHFSTASTVGPALHLTIEPSDTPSPNVALATLLAHLVSRGMDSGFVERALNELSLSALEVAAALPDSLAFTISPGDLVVLRRVGLLDRLTEDVCFMVDEEAKERWLAGFDQHLEGRALTGKVRELRQLVAQKADAGTWRFLPIDREDSECVERSGVAGRLLLSLFRTADGQPCEIWAEDRTLSLTGKVGKASVIDVVAVLDRLSHGLTEAQRVDATRRLRSAGYGFTLPDAKAIVDALLSAPMDGRALLESDELAAIRRDFAVQFANSRYLIDKAGGATSGEPELLFLSRLLRLVGEVFGALWSRPRVRDEQLHAAADWVSRHLRVEQAEFLPRDNRTIAARESLLFLEYLSLIGAVFNVTGNSLRQLRERRSTLLQWVLETIVDPGLEIHRSFRNRLIDYFAEALASLGKPDSSHPDASKDLLAGLVLDYLDAFPEAWRHSLQRHRLLGGLLPLREIEIIGIGKDFKFEAEKFYAAISEAYASGRSTVPILESKRSAVISAISDTSEATDGPVAFRAKTGRKQVSFADDRLELESNVVDQRLRALRRHPDWFDLRAPELDKAARTIAENPNPTMRRKLLADVQAKAMTWRLRTLQGQISERGSSDRELLLPPHPDSVRRFLRLSTPVDITSPGWLDGPFALLRDEVGPLGALARVGGIPFELGADITSAIVGAVDQFGHDEALRRVGPTPMVRTALFSALLRAGTPNLDLSGLTQPWTDYGVLFQALLRLAFRSARRREEWLEVPEPERSILLWVHANSVLEILEGQGAEPNEAAKVIDGFVSELIDDAYRRAKLSTSRLFEPAGSTWRQTAGVAIAYAVRDRAVKELGGSQLKELRAALARQIGDDWLVELELWTPHNASEPLSCWLTIDAVVPLATAGIAGVPPPLDERSPQALALLLIQKVADEAVDEAASSYWPLLWMIGVRELDVETRSRVKALIGSAQDLPSITSQEGRVWGGALRYRSELYGMDRDDASFRTMFLAAAAQARSHHPRETVSDISPTTPVVSTFVRLTEAIWQFASVSSATLNDCTVRFAELIILLANAWPSCLLACLALLDRIASQLDTEPAGPLWDAINLLRSR